MRKILVFISLLFLMISCSDNSDCCVIVDTATDIHFIKPDGSNFFDTLAGSPDIRVFFEKNGELEEVFRGNLDYPQMYFFYKVSGKFIMRLFPSDYLEKEYSSTCILLNDADMDTIRCKFNTNNSNLICTDVWYNGLKRCSAKEPRKIEVIKYSNL